MEPLSVTGATADSIGPEQGRPGPESAESTIFPMSFSQQRLWFLDQLEPGKSVYNVSEAVGLRGTLDVPALERSINEIVRRHDTLRTRFAEVDDNPSQIVAPSLQVPLALRDLTQLSDAERETTALRLASDAAAEPFDLSRGPLIRTLLIRLRVDEHVFVVITHHIISEGGWSMGVFFRELGTLYNAFSAGRPSPLPELALQFGDYAVWQQEWLQGSVLDQQLAYWKEHLKKARQPFSICLLTGRVRRHKATVGRESRDACPRG